jgi:hypothetical protein
MAVYVSKEHGPVTRIHFCSRFLQSVYGGAVDEHLPFCSHEAWFWLHAEVNSQNNQNWSAENPGPTNFLVMTKQLLCDVR